MTGELPVPPLRIGLTGPIGCGKTTVARWLAVRGAAVIDADALAREVTAPGTPGLAEVISRFGPAFLRSDGSLDRAALGRLVFADPAALRDLEAIVHPAVRVEILARIAAAAAAGAAAIVIEAIRLVEGGLAATCDETWLVTCSPVTQRIRLAARDDDPGAAEQRVRVQGDLVGRLRPVATRELATDGPAEEVERAVADAYAAALERHQHRSG